MMIMETCCNAVYLLSKQGVFETDDFFGAALKICGLPLPFSAAFLFQTQLRWHSAYPRGSAVIKKGKLRNVPDLFFS